MRPGVSPSENWPILDIVLVNNLCKLAELFGSEYRIYYIKGLVLNG